MTDEPHTDIETPPPPGLLNLSDGDRQRLGEALRELLAAGSINGMETAKSGIYHWCRQYFDWLREAAAMVGLEVALLHEERLIQAVPQFAAMRLKLRQDATLVWLALWYAGDVRWRDDGQDQAFLTVSELLGLIQDQLLPDAAGQFSRGRLRDILRQAERFNLIRFESADPFEESGIEVLPAIRRIIPFRDLAQWSEDSAAFRKADTEAVAEADETEVTP
ncbi:MAG: DUF4194 domain-containing protein [Verrucomicrobia bacterium]|nr:DUF4194 domain-containing protein [Verrucomicrobiota bacterium]